MRTSRNLHLCFALAIVAIGVSACSSRVDTPTATAEQVEASINLYGSDFDRLVGERTTSCARFNGLVDYTFDQADAGGQLAVSPSLERGLTERDTIAINGSGLIASLGDDQDKAPVAPKSAAERLTDDERAVIHEGPVVSPETGEILQTGCIQWARRSVESSDVFQQRVELGERYAAFIDENFTQSPALGELNLKWSRCMAENGHFDLSEPGDQLHHLLALRTQVSSGQRNYDDALRKDIAITLAAHDCLTEISSDRRRLLNDVAASFAESLES